MTGESINRKQQEDIAFNNLLSTWQVFESNAGIEDINLCSAGWYLGVRQLVVGLGLYDDEQLAADKECKQVVRNAKEAAEKETQV